MDQFQTALIPNPGFWIPLPEPTQALGRPNPEAGHLSPVGDTVCKACSRRKSLHGHSKSSPRFEAAVDGPGKMVCRKFPWSLHPGKRFHRRSDPSEDTPPAFLVSKAWCSSWNLLFSVDGKRFHRNMDFNFSGGYSCSTLWTKEIVIDPSPTADATRFTFPARTSPTAKTPGTLVSRR